MGYTDFDKIMPGLFVGSFPEPGALAPGQFDVLVLCAKELQPEARGYPVREIIRTRMDDRTDRPVDELTRTQAITTATAVAKRVRDGKNVLVTCQMGINRSALVAGLAMVQLTGQDGWYALSMVQARRRCKPRYGHGELCPLANKHFAAWLSTVRGKR